MRKVELSSDQESRYKFRIDNSRHSGSGISDVRI